VILLFFAGAASEFVVYLWMRLVAEKEPRRLPLLAVTAAEYALWAIIVRRIVLEDWPAVVAYALGGLTGVLVATFLPKRKSE
jgi:hypothetical protein